MDAVKHIEMFSQEKKRIEGLRQTVWMLVNVFRSPKCELEKQVFEIVFHSESNLAQIPSLLHNKKKVIVFFININKCYHIICSYQMG